MGGAHDGNINGEYATKEAAFEAATVAASLAVRQGHRVHLSVPGRDEGEFARPAEIGSCPKSGPLADRSRCKSHDGDPLII
jgi:hypothetical protein